MLFKTNACPSQWLRVFESRNRRSFMEIIRRQGKKKKEEEREQIVAEDGVLFLFMLKGGAD